MTKKQIVQAVVVTLFFALGLPGGLGTSGPIKVKITPTPVRSLAAKVTNTPGPTVTPVPPKQTATWTLTPVPPSATLVPSSTPTVAPSDTAVPTDTPAATDTLVPTDTPVSSATPTSSPVATDTPQAVYTPRPSAPACAAPDTSVFHTLWNSALGCHYDHEHGDNPFTPEVAAVFPGIQNFLCGAEIGSCNPSSPAENTAKHGGFKWTVMLTLPQPCTPFQDSTVGASAAAVQVHSFGDQAIELEARFHSAVAFVRQCVTSDPTDTGLVYVGSLQDYGQRVIPYQGTVVGYPNQPVPAYNGALGPYWSHDCVGPVIQCRISRDFVLSRNLPVADTVTSQSSTFAHPFMGTHSLQVLFRLQDGYRLFDWNDQDYPFTFPWLCSTDGGLTYNPVGCRYNNSTVQVQEIYGEVQSAWDNLAGFDTNPVVGRITADGFTDVSGNLSGPCLPGGGCYPIKLVNAFVGKWGAVMVFTPNKGTNVVPFNPSHNIFFCNGVVCGEHDSGAVPSGWIGAQN
jgi:hypothetical protein